jgi:FAD/FMN-containing dehydrogenase
VNAAEFRAACKGVVAFRGDANFPELLHGNLWNRLIPERAPEAVVRVTDEEDVIAAIRFARANKWKVAIRGGGHNWCQPTLRHGGLLIDLSKLDQVISIDAGARRAVLQPIVSNRDVQRALNAKGLSFPTGHCPQVKISGYLLGGGMSLNQGVWGIGADSVEAIELVTAEGKLITASKDENAEWFWAARGAGSGFFGVVTRYHLRLYPMPQAIHGSTCYFALEDAAEVGAWLDGLAPQLSPAVELSLFLLEAPPDLKKPPGTKIAMATGLAFADTPEDARALLQPLEAGPPTAQPLSTSFAKPLTFEEFFDGAGAMWPEGLRNRVEATYSDSPVADLARAAAAHMSDCPSPLTVVLFTIFTGAKAPQGDRAYSMSSRVYGGPWTMWRDAADDAANTEWHDALTASLRPFNVGCYVGESDTVRRPSNAVQAFSPESWQRLADLRGRLDPDGVFFGFFDGFAQA